MANYGLEGLVTIITGKPGILNTEIASEFVGAGAIVVLASQNLLALDTVVGQLRQEGGTAAGIATDLTSHREVNNLIAETVERYGRLDVMINSAGNAHGEFASNPNDGFENEWDRRRGHNLVIACMCSFAASRQMIKQQSGNLINIATSAGDCNSPGSQRAENIIGVSHALAYSWAQHNINVNCIVPGIPATTEGGRQVAQCGRRPGPEDVAAVARFLASPAASMITDETIQVRAWSEDECHPEMSQAPFGGAKQASDPRG